MSMSRARRLLMMKRGGGTGVPADHTFTITGNILRRSSGSGGAAVGNAGGTVVDGGGNTLIGFATLT